MSRPEKSSVLPAENGVRATGGRKGNAGMEAHDREALVAFCREMIRRPSLSGKEQAVADFLETGMKSLGFDSTERDEYGNVIGRIRVGDGGGKILFEGHMDHVDVSDPSSWTFPPFSADVSEGKIYGRGATDMKGNLSAMTHAAAMIRKNAAGLNGEVIVAGCVHEECFEGVASEGIAARCKPDCVVIGEPSSLNLMRGQRGRAEIVLETYGKSAHSSNPEVGLNAVKTMLPLLSLLEEKFTPDTHPVLGKGVMELTDIISTPYPGASVVPERCRVTFDRRLLVADTERHVLEQVERVMEEVCAKNPAVHAAVFLSKGHDTCYTGKAIEAVRYAPGWLFEEKHWFVSTALKGLRSAGLCPNIGHYAFCTNGSFYAGKAGIPTIGFGGSKEHLAHVVDEYIEIEQLEKACDGYVGIIRSVLGGE